MPSLAPLAPRGSDLTGACHAVHRYRRPNPPTMARYALTAALLLAAVAAAAAQGTLAPTPPPAMPTAAPTAPVPGTGDTDTQTENQPPATGFALAGTTYSNFVVVAATGDFAGTQEDGTKVCVSSTKHACCRMHGRRQ